MPRRKGGRARSTPSASATASTAGEEAGKEVDRATAAGGSGSGSKAPVAAGRNEMSEAQHAMETQVVGPFPGCGASVLRLVNVTATADMKCSIDLKTVVMRARNAEYNPKRFSACVSGVRYDFVYFPFSRVPPSINVVAAVRVQHVRLLLLLLLYRIPVGTWVSTTAAPVGKRSKRPPCTAIDARLVS